MALDQTEWPSDIAPPSAIRSWLSLLFEIVDSKAADSGVRMAALYSDNANVYGMHGKVEGKKELLLKVKVIAYSKSTTAIAESRKAAWDNFDSRKHEILRIYAGKADYSDLLLIGKLTAGLKNGNQVVTEFIAQIQFEGDTAKNPQGTLYKVWGDSAPWIKAMQAT